MAGDDGTDAHTAEPFVCSSLGRSRKTLHIKRHQWVFSNVNPLSGCNAGLKYINRTPSRLTSQVERYGHKQERRREEREPASCVGTSTWVSSSQPARIDRCSAERDKIMMI